MNMFRIKSTVICILVSACMYTSTNLQCNYPHRLTNESPKLQSAYNAARFITTTCSEGFSCMKSFFTNYAVPYTLAGAKHTKEFIQHYAIPYSITGAKHTKEFCKNYVIPRLVSGAKTSYQKALQLCCSIKKVYQQSKVSPGEQQSVIHKSKKAEEENCCICFERLEDNRRAKLKPCGHNLFHQTCIDENYAHGNTVCPLCRQYIEKISQDMKLPAASCRGYQV